MKKFALLIVTAVFVFGLSAQTFTPVQPFMETPKSNAIGLMPPMPSIKKAYESVGWLNPTAYLEQLLPSTYKIADKRTFMEIFPDSCMNFVWDKPDGLTEISIWRHALGNSFDPYSESFDKVFQSGIFPTPFWPAVKTYPYAIDTVNVYGLYHWGEKDGYNPNSPDTIRLFLSYFKVYEYIGSGKEWYSLHYNSDTHLDTAMFSPIITFDPDKMKQSKNGLIKPIAANTVTIDYVLQAGDTNRYWDSIVDNETKSYFSIKAYKIPINNSANGFEVPAGAIVSCIVNFVPGYSYNVGDTLEYGKVTADDKLDGDLHYYHNTFQGMVFYETDKNNMKAFCDPYGYNASFFDHQNTHYQIWNRSFSNANTVKLYNSMYYPTHSMLNYIQYHFTYDSLGAREVVDSIEWARQHISVTEANSVIESVYPNPANDMVTVTLKNNDQSVIRIYNVMGQEVKTIYAYEQKNAISIKDLSAGMYIISVEQKGQRYNTKLVKR